MAPYRSNQPAIQAALVEQRELADLTRDARFRRTRAALSLGAVFTVVLSGMFLLVRIPHGRVLRCHHVEIRYEQAEGVPPPPAAWTRCE